jgi:hypothetical protein
LNVQLFDLASKEHNQESRSVQLGSYLAFYDILQTRISKHQNFELVGYLNYPVCSFHPLFSSSTGTKIKYPKTAFQADSIQKQIKNLARNCFAGFSLQSRISWPNQTVNILELYPYLMYIISPPFRPVFNV